MKRLLVVLFAILIPVSALAVAETQAQLRKEAKISMKKISSAELERENGKLIYSFDIKKSGQTGVTEVAVDAISGEIVDVHHETPAKEATEKKQEAKEKSPTKH